MVAVGTVDVVNVGSVGVDYIVPFSIISYKCKNHFYEMKGDVGMSNHEKERDLEDVHQDRK